MDFKELISIKYKEIRKETIILSKETGKWCKRPYKKYKKGCMNYNKKFCPPNAPFLGDFIDKFNNFYLIYINLNFKEYKEERAREWDLKNFSYTEGNLECLLYWQNSLVKYLKEYILKIYKLNQRNKDKIYLLSCGSGFLNSYSMEAVGINVFSTLKLNKIKIEIKPTNKVILVCLLCSNNDLIFKNKDNQKFIDFFFKE